MRGISGATWVGQATPMAARLGPAATGAGAGAAGAGGGLGVATIAGAVLITGGTTSGGGTKG
ncbi:MAG: hypothetical protein WCL01_09650, partial [Comamonadaceae bacterium]